MERVWGVEPHSLAWKAKVIPIYDTRLQYSSCRGTRIRTEIKRSQTVRATVAPYPDINIYYKKIPVLSKEKICDNIELKFALVAQWIELRSSKAQMWVRFLPRAQGRI